MKLAKVLWVDCVFIKGNLCRTCVHTVLQTRIFFCVSPFCVLSIHKPLHVNPVHSFVNKGPRLSFWPCCVYGNRKVGYQCSDPEWGHNSHSLWCIFSLLGFWARMTFLIMAEMMSLSLSVVPRTHQPSRSSHVCSLPPFCSTTCLILETHIELNGSNDQKPFNIPRVPTILSNSDWKHFKSI